MTVSPRATLEPATDVKFGQVGIANLRLKQLDPEGIERELAEKVQNAPKLFARAPVVIDLSHLPSLPDADAVRDLVARVHRAGMIAVGLSYGTSENEELARALDLPLFAKFRAAYERNANEKPAAAVPVPEPAQPAPPADTPRHDAISGMIHDQPVRSGQQVYARGRDLILTGMVANGAEVIADGSIHIYGALRGRALAGAQGDATARIFCREFHAELVSIAGQYRVFEDIPENLRGKPAQAWLDADKLRVEKL